MGRIGVYLLLRADRKVERLERKRSTAIETREQIQDGGIHGDRPDVFVEFPGVLDASVTYGLDAFRVVQISAHSRGQRCADAIYPAVEFDVLEIYDGEAIPMQLRRDRLFRLAQAEMREFRVKGRRLYSRNAGQCRLENRIVHACRLI